MMGETQSGDLGPVDIIGARSRQSGAGDAVDQVADFIDANQSPVRSRGLTKV